MESNTRVSRTVFIKTLQKKNINLFDIVQVRNLFALDNENTLRHLLRRLKKEEIVASLVKGKYLFNLAKKEPLEYEIANFLYNPSYISLESALSFYGIISQFPYRITSVTVKRTREIKIGAKTYSFAKIKKSYFNDFVKQDNFLIASPQKSLFDYLYFSYKGLRSLDLLDEIEGGTFKKQKIKNYFRRKVKGKFKKFLLNNRVI